MLWGLPTMSGKSESSCQQFPEPLCWRTFDNFAAGGRLLPVLISVRPAQPCRQVQAPYKLTHCCRYNTLISALGKAGRLHEALEMYGSMHSAGLPGDVFTLAALITACEKVQLPSQGEEARPLAAAPLCTDAGSNQDDSPRMSPAWIAAC